MPWKETCPMFQRQEFIEELLRDRLPVAALCRAFCVSRKTAYKWIARFRGGGMPAMADRSRARLTQDHAVADHTRGRIIAFRREHPTWGPKKIRWGLEREHPGERWPALSTIDSILHKAGLVTPRSRASRADHPRSPCLDARSPNSVWTIDFKGHFLVGDGSTCWPLTVVDAHSRYVLEVRALARPTGVAVDAAVNRLFRTHGLPDAIRSDNGEPFAGVGLGGLTHVSVGWMRQGIALQRIDPGKPQQNGRHERMHRDLKRETAIPPAASLGAQQQRFNRWRHVFVEQRPHEALDGRRPAELYTPSDRPFRERPDEPDYPRHWLVRSVGTSGTIKWHGEHLYLSEALRGQRIALQEVDHGLWSVHFHRTELALLDDHNTLRRISSIRPKPTKRFNTAGQHQPVH